MFAATHRLAFIGLAAALSCSVAAPASADLLTQKALSASMAVEMAVQTIATCKTNGFAVSVTVVGRNGEPLLQIRGDGTGPHTVENSFKKAYTSRTFRIASGEMEDRLKKNPAMGAVFLSNITTSRGALPIKVGEEVIGAIGASGAPGGDKDEACVKAGIDKVASQLK